MNVSLKGNIFGMAQIATLASPQITITLWVQTPITRAAKIVLKSDRSLTTDSIWSGITGPVPNRHSLFAK